MLTLTRSNANLDNISSIQNQLFHHFTCHHIPCLMVQHNQSMRDGSSTGYTCGHEKLLHRGMGFKLLEMTLKLISSFRNIFHLISFSHQILYASLWVQVTIYVLYLANLTTKWLSRCCLLTHYWKTLIISVVSPKLQSDLCSYLDATYNLFCEVKTDWFSQMICNLIDPSLLVCTETTNWLLGW